MEAVASSLYGWEGKSLGAHYPCTELPGAGNGQAASNLSHIHIKSSIVYMGNVISITFKYVQKVI